MKHELMKLPYASLAPLMSDETLEYHHGKHHNTYVTNLNNLIAGTKYEDMSLEDIIKNSEGGLFNNAAQVFNHDFFFNGLTPNQGAIPSTVEKALSDTFGSVDKFKEEFTAKAIGQFGSGWAWLVKDSACKLQIVTTSNAGCPITDGLTPVLTCDVWEHAYYIDTRNARPKFLENFWQLVNWDVVASKLA
ncbi:superoxide dismutase [Aliarcobacter lanthieri]|uniref:superoxide dismutase n=1 Tax=Arcobacteraceae TaxID=2808963 RepID=UPI000DEA9208|nr:MULTISPECIES: superoxide dismutase [Arcobacteraceae]MBL3519556.1 superoxide dismutase [Aliarcobacter lanthieri]RBQ27019.1 superoxide dismutase [Fe] [Arcobacter sp. CECT 9188]